MSVARNEHAGAHVAHLDREDVAVPTAPDVVKHPDLEPLDDVAHALLALGRVARDRHRFVIGNDHDLFGSVQAFDPELIQGGREIDHVPVVDRDQLGFGEDDLTRPHGTTEDAGENLFAGGLPHVSRLAHTHPL